MVVAAHLAVVVLPVVVASEAPSCRHEAPWVKGGGCAEMLTPSDCPTNSGEDEPQWSPANIQTSKKSRRARPPEVAAPTGDIVRCNPISSRCHRPTPSSAGATAKTGVPDPDDVQSFAEEQLPPFASDSTKTSPGNRQPNNARKTRKIVTRLKPRDAHQHGRSLNLVTDSQCIVGDASDRSSTEDMICDNLPRRDVGSCAAASCPMAEATCDPSDDEPPRPSSAGRAYCIGPTQHLRGQLFAIEIFAGCM